MNVEPASRELAQLRRVSVFAREFPNLIRSATALRNQLARRNANGLAESGAIVRTRAGLMVDAQKYFTWLLRQDAPDAADAQPSSGLAADAQRQAAAAAAGLRSSSDAAA